jgi:hypothetical protein
LGTPIQVIRAKVLAVHCFRFRFSTKLKKKDTVLLAGSGSLPKKKDTILSAASGSLPTKDAYQN